MMRMRWIWLGAAALAAAGLIGCATAGPAARSTAYTAGSPEEHRSLGLSKSSIEPWEDGARTTGAKGTYEWW